MNISRMSLLTLVILISLSFSFISCDEDSPGSPGPYVPGDLEPIEGNVILSVHEDYDFCEMPAPPKIVVKLETDFEYSNCNNEIVASIEQNNSNLSLIMYGINIPDIVLPAFGPATFYNLRTMNSGQYAVDLKYLDYEDEVLLTVTDSSLFISNPSNNFVFIDEQIFWRYPVKSMQIRCAGIDSTSWILNNFTEYLANELDINEFEFPSGGINPYTRIPADSTIQHPRKYFYYSSEEDFARTEGLLSIYVESFDLNEVNASIYISNWQNIYYHGNLESD